MHFSYQKSENLDDSKILPVWSPPGYWPTALKVYKLGYGPYYKDNRNIENLKVVRNDLIILVGQNHTLMSHLIDSILYVGTQAVINVIIKRYSNAILG